MSLRSLELRHAAIPLKSKIAHASHERTASDSLIVRVELEDGTVGYGEGVPRPYVTGETIDTTFATLGRFDTFAFVGHPSSYADMVDRLSTLTFPETLADPRGMAGNAARCALELALLDAFGRRFGVSVAEAVRLAASREPGLNPRERPDWVRYGGAIMASSRRREYVSAWKMSMYRFAQVKMKVGVAGQNDPARVAEARRILGRKVDLRLDANEAWPASELLDRVRPLVPFDISALEQPVPHAEVEALAELRPRLGIPVMLDESLCGYPDAERAIRDRTADLLNVRISKCGGLLPTIRIVGLAARSGLGLQLGCHPGETGVLSAAGRHLAGILANVFRYCEGSYDRHVLARNVIREDITFRYGGWARPLAGPGLGVTVDPQALERMTVRREEFRP